MPVFNNKRVEFARPAIHNKTAVPTKAEIPAISKVLQSLSGYLPSR